MAKKKKIFSENMSASVIFADEIRREDNGKALHVGVYSNNIILPNIPILIKNFCISVTSKLPLDLSHKSLHYIVYLPGEKEPFLREEVILNLEAREKTTDTHHFVVNWKKDLENLELKTSGYIEVWVESSKEKLIAGKLKVETPPAPKSLDLQNVIFPVLYYEIAKKNFKEQKGELASKLLEIMSATIESMKIPASDNDLILLTGENLFSIFFAKPEPLDTKFRFDVKPDFPAEIVERHPYGMTVKVNTNGQLVEEFKHQRLD